MSMCSEEDEESEDDGEELDATSVYVSLFAVADRMERWYAGGRARVPRGPCDAGGGAAAARARRDQCV